MEEERVFYRPVEKVNGVWRGVRLVRQPSATTSKDVRGLKNSRFPERVGRMRFDTDSDPTLRGAEEGAMATGRIERVEPT